MALVPWNATVQDDAGNYVPLPVVTVRNAADDTLATIYDESGSPLSNPLTGLANGFVQFFAEPGRYTIEGALDGSTTATWVWDAAELRVPSDMTRAEFVANVDKYEAIPDGSVQVIDGLFYRKDGGSSITDMPGYSPEGEVDIRHFGNSVEMAVAYVEDGGRNEIYVSSDFTPTGDLLGRSNIMFYGPGSFSGYNQDLPIYRRQVTPEEAPSSQAFEDSFHVPTNTKKELTVVLVGDSLTTYGANTISSSSGIAERLRAKLEKDNPECEITFYSRGIGAQKWTDLDGVPDPGTPFVRYPWYTDTLRPWLDYVEDLSPDVVIFSFGMNDQANFDRTALESVVSKVQAFANPPIMAFITNMVPNLSPHPDNASFGSYSGQEGRDSVAGWTRTYALYHGHPLIDVNRTFNIVRDGRDIIDTYLEEQEEVDFSGVASEFLAADSEKCRDFSIKALIEASAWTNVDPLSVSLCDGVVNPDGSSNAVFINDQGGFLQFRFYRGGSGSLYKTEVSDIPTPSGDETIEVSVRNNVFTFRIYPTAAGYDAGVQPYESEVIRYGGLFRPSIRYFGGGGTGPVLSAILSVGKEKRFKPSITDLDLWGIPTSSTGGNRETTGGNGVNHPTAEGTAAIYGLHFSNNTYKLINLDSDVEPWSPVVSDATTGGNTATVGSVSAWYKVMDGVMHAWGNITGINTTGMTAGNEIVVQGLPIAAVSLPGTPRFPGPIRVRNIAFSGAVTCEVVDNTDYIKFHDSQSGDGGDRLLVSSLISGTADMDFYVTYPL